MIDDLRLCDLCAAVYSRNDPTWGNDRIRVWSFYEDGYLVIVGAGSRTLEDWWRDAQAAEMLGIPGVGSVAESFWQDALSVVDAIATEINHASLPVILTGHSKAAAEAQCLATQLIQRTILPAKLTTFEPPPVGDALGKLLWMVPDGRDYAHNGDPVVDAPPGRPHPRLLTWFPDPPVLDPLNPIFANHSLTTIRPALVKYLATSP